MIIYTDQYIHHIYIYINTFPKLTLRYMDDPESYPSHRRWWMRAHVTVVSEMPSGSQWWRRPRMVIYCLNHWVFKTIIYNLW